MDLRKCAGGKRYGDRVYIKGKRKEKKTKGKTEAASTNVPHDGK